MVQRTFFIAMRATGEDLMSAWIELRVGASRMCSQFRTCACREADALATVSRSASDSTVVDVIVETVFSGVCCRANSCALTSLQGRVSVAHRASAACVYVSGVESNKSSC